MSTQYFLKEIPTNRLFLPTGAPIPFVAVSREFGILATDDALTITELDKAISRQIGGVSRITQDQYDEFQKKKLEPNLQLSSPPNRVEIRPMSQQALQELKRQGAVAAVGEVVNAPTARVVTAEPQKVAPLEVPKEFTKPKVGRIPSASPQP